MFGGSGGTAQTKPAAGGLFGRDTATVGTGAAGSSLFNSGAITDRGTVTKTGGLFGAATTQGQNQSSPNPGGAFAPKTDGGLFSQNTQSQDTLGKKQTAIFGGGSGGSGTGLFGNKPPPLTGGGLFGTNTMQ